MAMAIRICSGLRDKLVLRFLIAVVALALLAAACGGSNASTDEDSNGDTATDASSSGDASDAGPNESSSDDAGTTPENLLSRVPDEFQVLYEGREADIKASAYGSYEPPTGPAKLCFAEFAQINAWLVTVENEMIRLANEYDQIASIETAVADSDVATQITQIRNFVDTGCDVIISTPSSPTGLNDAIEYAHSNGVPFIAIAGSVTSPLAINVDNNFNAWAADMARAAADELGGSGTILLVHGVDGHPVTETERDGLDSALADLDLEVVGQVNGNWTPSVTKQAVIEFLGTYQGDVDAVWTAGSETRHVAEAFQQANRAAPVVTGSVSGDALGFWNENPDVLRFTGNAVLPTYAAQSGFRVALRLLAGQDPIVNLLMVPLPSVPNSALGDWVADCLTPDSGDLFPIGPVTSISIDQMNQYFVDGADVGYDYSTTPGPCE